MRQTNANPSSKPYSDGLPLHAPDDTDTPIPHLAEIYRTIIGTLRYIADSTRPDIAFVVSKLAGANQCPTKRHWSHLKHLVRYLKGTINTGILYSPSPTKSVSLTTYTDADYAGDKLDCKSTSGAVHLINGSPISWISTKQTMQALSTCESEYIAAALAVQYTQWLRRILAELHALPNTPTLLFMDNQAAISIANNTAPTNKRKFIDLRHHYLREHIQKGNITLQHVPSNKMLADILTKPLKNQTFTNLKNLLHLCSAPANDKRAQPILLTKQGDCYYAARATKCFDTSIGVLTAPA